MKKFLLAGLLAVAALSMFVPDAEARRMGGGGSFGKQSTGVSRQSTPPTQNTAAPLASSQAAAKPSMMRGLLGGALLGLGLGALLSNMGIDGELASMISTVLMLGLLGGAGYFIFRMLRGGNGGRAPGQAGLRPVTASASAPRSPEIGSHVSPQAQALAFQAPAVEGGAGEGLPADFDVPGFARNAKTYFIRLQAAWDRADVNDLREFTSPEVFAELKVQLQERGASANHTDVVSLDADVMRVETIDGEYLVSVRFTGIIKEGEDAAPEPFVEVWNLSKSVSGPGGWLLAGIQQPA